MINTGLSLNKTSIYYTGVTYFFLLWSTKNDHAQTTLSFFF